MRRDNSNIHGTSVELAAEVEKLLKHHQSSQRDRMLRRASKKKHAKIRLLSSIRHGEDGSRSTGLELTLDFSFTWLLIS